MSRFTIDSAAELAQITLTGCIDRAVDDYNKADRPLAEREQSAQGFENVALELFRFGHEEAAKRWWAMSLRLGLV